MSDVCSVAGCGLPATMQREIDCAGCDPAPFQAEADTAQDALGQVEADMLAVMQAVPVDGPRLEDREAVADLIATGQGLLLQRTLAGNEVAMRSEPHKHPALFCDTHGEA